MTRATRGRSVRRHPSVIGARASGVLAILWAVVGGTACWGTPPVIVDFSPPARQYRASEYHGVYERWTRHEKIMFEVDAALEVWATYRSQEFREAFVAHYADTYGMNDDATESLRRAQHEAGTAAYEFVVTGQSSNYKWNDLEKKSSPWRVLLLDGAGHELVPEQITVERYPDLFEREFYPAKTPFSKTYLIRFTRAPGHDDGWKGERTGEIRLRFAGPRGRGELRWADRP